MATKQCVSCNCQFDYTDEGKDTCLKCISRKDIDLQHFMPIFCSYEPWFGYLSKFVHKTPTNDENFPTIGVYMDKFTSLHMKYNEEFFKELPWIQKIGVMKHEFYHIVLNHLCVPGEDGIRFSKDCDRKWMNVAMDLAINSMLKYEELPKIALYPGKRFEVSPKEIEKINKLPEHEREKALKNIEDLREFIFSMPVGECAEWYYNKIKFNKEIGDILKEPQMSKVGFLDDHDDFFDGLSDEHKEQIRQKIKSLVREACERNSWGSIPNEIREKLKKYYSSIINWRSVLRSFVGMCRSAGHTHSIKKINKRFPYIHSGVKIKRQANIAIAVDESGSVSDEQLELFFAELVNLSMICDFTLIPFDTVVNEEKMFKWKKNQKIVPERVQCGGTDFSVPTIWVNDRRKQFDGLIILTDGYCEKPIASMVKRAFIICPDGKLAFETSDLVINMTK